MCGIVGFLDKTLGKTNDAQAPAGRTILAMLNALACRGPDSAGVALFAPRHDGRFVLRVKLGDNGDAEKSARRLTVFAKSLDSSSELTSAGAYARLTAGTHIDPANWTSKIESLDHGYEVVSLGHSLEIVKQVGSPAKLEAAYYVSRMPGAHGIGHTRMSTESKVDLSHSQPFWGRGQPDLAIVHNGHITNYHQLRRRYQQRGVVFHTENDSEIIAIYLAERLAAGQNLEAALDAMMSDLDGSFSCVVATESELAFIKDPFAFKPLLVAETDRFVAIATEEVAIRAALPGNYRACEPGAREIKVWRR
jgi:glutamate synthase domain-containing protein 1